MKNFKVNLQEDLAEKQVLSFAKQRGWKESLSDPKKPEKGVFPNPQTPAEFAADLFKFEIEEAYINEMSQEAAAKARETTKAELHKKFNH